MELTIGHLYPDLLNLYGDRGNIRCMVKRLNWRGIDAHVKEFQLHDPIDFNSLDISSISSNVFLDESNVNSF